MKLIPSFSTLAVAAALSIPVPASLADIIHYRADFAPEVSGATGTGFALVTYDSTAQTLDIHAEWSGLSAGTTVAHIHCCTAIPFAGTIGVAVTPVTFPGFPTGLTAGTYDLLGLDLTLAPTFTSGFVNNFAGAVLANAEEALIAGFDAGRAYFNVHSQAFPGGEIRGFLVEVPEPATLALLGLGLLGIAGLRRRTA